MKYIKEEVEVMLRKYKENEAKLTEIKLKQEEYEERLKYAGTVNIESKEEAIAGMQLSGQTYNNIPAKTNKITDKTYNTAMSYKKEQNHINKENRVFLERKLTEFEQEEKNLNKKIVRVKNLLEGLTKEERFVIEEYYLNNSNWDYVEKEYFSEFEKHKTIKRLQSHRDKAIEKMLNILNTGLE